MYHRGECLTEMDFYGPRALVLPPAGLNWWPFEWTWTDSGHSQYVLAEGKPQQAWICMQVHTGLLLSQPLPPPTPVWSLEPLYTIFRPGLQVQIMLCISQNTLLSIPSVWFVLQLKKAGSSNVYEVTSNLRHVAWQLNAWTKGLSFKKKLIKQIKSICNEGY